MRELVQLLLPSVRWDPTTGFASARAAVGRAVGNGVSGFVIEGGSADGVGELASEIRRMADAPPIIALEPAVLGRAAWRDRPVSIPPLGAIASLRDPLVIRGVARAIARAALEAGCNAIIAPCCDVARTSTADAFGPDVSEVAAATAEWIDATQAEGVLCVAGRFPGGGRVDRPAVGLPIVRDPDDTLYSTDLVPFRAAIDAGVAALLVEDAIYPSLDDPRTPAPLSRAILVRLLRHQLGFEGLAVADATSLAVILGRRVGAAELVSAGIDLVLRPANLDVELRALIDAVESRALDRERVADAARRVRVKAEMASVSSTRTHDGDDDWLDDVAERAVTVARGRSVRLAPPIEVAFPGLSAGDAPDLLSAFTEGIGEAGGEAIGVRHQSALGEPARTPLILITLPNGRDDAARAICADARRLGREVALVWCAHPATAPRTLDASLVIACWSPTRAMLRAAGRWLIRRV